MTFDGIVAGIGEVLDVFTAQRSMTLLGFAMTIAFFILMVKANRSGDSRINLDFLFVDPATGTITAPKFAYTGAFFVSTYVVLFLLVTQRFSENVFLYYLAAWTGAGMVAFVAQRFGKTPPNLAADAPDPVTTTETTQITKQTSVVPTAAPSQQPQPAEAATEVGGPSTIGPAKKGRR